MHNPFDDIDDLEDFNPQYFASDPLSPAKRDREEGEGKDITAVAAMKRLLTEDSVDLAENPGEMEAFVKAHNDSELGKRFSIRPTQYGHGLFSEGALKREEMIGEYEGVEVPEEIADNLPHSYNKIVPSSRAGHSIVGDVMKKGKTNFASFANDPGYTGTKKTGVFKNESNVKLSTGKDGKVYMTTTKAIAPGQELLLDYGPEYWEGNEEYHKGDKRALKATAQAAEKARRKKR
jgi:hypothetical protein